MVHQIIYFVTSRHKLNRVLLFGFNQSKLLAESLYK